MRKEMSGFKARSFWLIIAAVLITAARQKGYTLPINDEQLADLIMGLAPAFLGAWAWLERLFGKAKLVFRRV